MKKLFLLFVTTSIYLSSSAQIGKDLKSIGNKVKSASSSKEGLSNEDIVTGLKEALQVGATKAVDVASADNGFYKNPEIFIPFPPEVEQVKEKAIQLGLQNKVDEFEQTMNRAAEKASKEATPIFMAAITSMTVKDGYNILKGNEDAATLYLKKSTSDELIAKFKPIVDKAVAEVNLTKYWTPLANSYNTASRFTGGGQVDPDLEMYITQKAIDGLFVLIAEKEKDIRQNPGARASEILKKVFGN